MQFFLSLFSDYSLYYIKHHFSFTAYILNPLRVSKHIRPRPECAIDFCWLLVIPGDPMSSCSTSSLSQLMFLSVCLFFLRPSGVHLRAACGIAAGGMRSTWHFHLFRRTCCVIGSVPVLLRNSWFEIVWGQYMRRILCRHLFWKTSSLWLMVLVIFQNSAPYSRVLKTLLLKNRIFVFCLMFLDLQVPRSEAKACLAFEMWTRISSSPSPLVDTLDHR